MLLCRSKRLFKYLLAIGQVLHETYQGIKYISNGSIQQFVNFITFWAFEEIYDNVKLLSYMK